MFNPHSKDHDSLENIHDAKLTCSTICVCTTDIVLSNNTISYNEVEKR